MRGGREGDLNAPRSRGARRHGVAVSWRPSTEFAGSLCLTSHQLLSSTQSFPTFEKVYDPLQSPRGERPGSSAPVLPTSTEELYRGEGILCGTPEEVWDCIKPVAGGLREKWDENVTSFEIIESITNTLHVSRTSTPSAAMKIISPRDFVDLVLIKKYEDGTISSNATHVEHALCPPKPGFVRGFNYPCGCFCEPLPGEPGKTRLISFFQTDLSGYLPQNVVDSFFPRSMACFYANLQKAVKQFHS